MSFGAAGIASADSYGSSSASAGPCGAVITSTGAVAGHDNDGRDHHCAAYYDSVLSAGPYGAGGGYTVSGTDGHSAFSAGKWAWAGPGGAHSGETHATAGHHHTHDWDGN
ncbi:hypothetical protein [Amycolatopsis viridis]|uniref:Uncharacterized protein n=1 Tax=Amycolatopsis viridis TaxID=185678 RepID=A0ABX0SX17_9PSEU|nr:hypothetical protein [Amycolatopsis viridis]NIH79880.1 hypothetical protein [Amycolatopsis viridis]